MIIVYVLYYLSYYALAQQENFFPTGEQITDNSGSVLDVAPELDVAPDDTDPTSTVQNTVSSKKSNSSTIIIVFGALIFVLLVSIIVMHVTNKKEKINKRKKKIKLTF